MTRRGPSPKGEYAGKSQVLSTRIRPDTREALQSAANASGRSLSQEIEYRLRRGLESDDKIKELFGSRRNYRIMQLVALCTELAIDPADIDTMNQDWLDSPVKFEIAKLTIIKLLESIRPQGPAPNLSAFAEFGIKKAPAELLHHVQTADPSLPLGVSDRHHLANLMKADLGEVAMRPKFFFGTADDMRRRADDIEEKLPKTSKQKKRRHKS
jgi:hypothetical protein